jgi:CRP/FNR family transcriptional regulator
MDIKTQKTKSRVVLLSVGDHANREGCSTCSLFQMCLPSNFNDREVQLFENIVAGRRRIARHASLFCQNDSFQMLYAIRFGQFKLIGTGLDGEPRVAGFHMAGDLVGMDGIARGHHSFRLMALENSEVCEIPFAAFSRVMSVEPMIQRKFLQAMSAANFVEHDNSRMLSSSSLDQRFATFLMNYGARYARLGYSDRSFRLSMSRGDIGSYLGTTVESVSRLIKRFNMQRLVSIDGREVKLHEVDYLRALATGDEKALARAVSQQGDEGADRLAISQAQPDSMLASPRRSAATA